MMEKKLENISPQRLLTRRQTLIGGAAAPLLTLGMPKFAHASPGFEQSVFTLPINEDRTTGNVPAGTADHLVISTRMPVTGSQDTVSTGGYGGGAGAGAEVTGYSTDTVITGPFGTVHTLHYKPFTGGDNFHRWDGFANRISYKHEDLITSHLGSTHRSLLSPVYPPDYPRGLIQSATLMTEDGKLGPHFISRSKWRERDFPYRSFYVFGFGGEAGVKPRYVMNQSGVSGPGAPYNQLVDTYRAIKANRDEALIAAVAGGIAAFLGGGLLAGTALYLAVASGGATMIAAGAVGAVKDQSLDHKVLENETLLYGFMNDRYNTDSNDGYNKGAYMDRNHSTEEWRDRIRLTFDT